MRLLLWPHLSIVPTFSDPLLHSGLVFAEFSYHLRLFVIIVIIMSKVILPFQAHLSRSKLGILSGAPNALSVLSTFRDQ